MSRRLWLIPPALLAALTGLALIPAAHAAPAPVQRKPSVEVVFCLDTTGSMSGLIEGAKLKIWSICTQILNAQPTPELKVGLLAFRDKGDEYITKVYDLRDDLDAVYADLKTFTANGGGDTPESVNQALDDAVNKIKWSTDRKALRIIFLVGDAPPHMDYVDDVKYPVTCKKAVEKGILINTVQCGTDAECTKCWKEIAEKGGGSYVAIPQAGGVRSLTTPYDRRLGELNTALLRTILVYGDPVKRDADTKKVNVATTLPAEVAADRAGYMAKEGKVAAYDLLDTIRAGKLKLETLKTEELPAEMQRMSAKERREHLDKVSLERAKLLKEAAELVRQRTAYITKELAKSRDSFDSQVLDLLRKQAAKRFRF